MKLGTGIATRKQQTCAHVSTITINASGIEREICESCGHVSFQFEDQDYEQVDRERFARPVDSETSSPARLPAFGERA